MRIATWNVEQPRPNGWKIPPAQRRVMAEVDADVWVLTETHTAHQPTDAHLHRCFTPPYPERLHEPFRWTAIWSRWPLTPITDPAPHRRGSVAALVHAPAGDVIVYGTVIAYANEPDLDDGTPVRMWEAHRSEIDRQGDEWLRLREAHPHLPLVVIGDLNQIRDGSNLYGGRADQARLTAALAKAGLRCATDQRDRVAGLDPDRRLVDHVCTTDDLSPKVGCREPLDGETVLSDHPVLWFDA